jgi:hypothetical protein
VAEALARDEPRAAAPAARKLGMADLAAAPASIRAKLPPEFRLLTRETHAGFDALADAAEAGSARRTLSQLSRLLQKCNACHSVYQFGVERERAPGAR